MPTWIELIKLGFFATLGWWLATLATTILDYAFIFGVQIVMTATTGQLI